MKHSKILEKLSLLLVIVTLIMVSRHVIQKRALRISETALKNDYRIYQNRPGVSVFVKEIMRYGRSKEQAVRLSRKIIVVSQCLRINPYIYAALVAQESAFNPDAVSPTFARGLTQFTSIAVKDVEIALRKGVSKDYFMPIIHNCIMPRIGKKTWHPIFRKYYKFHFSVRSLLHEPQQGLDAEEIEIAPTFGGGELIEYLETIEPFHSELVYLAASKKPN